MKQNYETGRSMVEMLGTLAIIGVLSVGGVMGYSYGMDKYRANQIINDIMLRTTDLLTQANQGHEALSLSEWDKEDTIYDFANPAYVEDENLIVLDVGTNKKMSKRVCEMVYDTLFNEAVQIDVNAVRADTNILCGKDNTMTFYFSTNHTAESNSTASTTATMTETTTTLPSEGCTSNSECGPDEYCAASAPTANNPFPDGKKGICTLVDFNKHVITVNGKTEIWHVSQYSMSYWEAVYACQRLNATIASAHDLYKNWTGRHFSTFELNDRANALAVACGLGSTYIQVSERTSNGLIYQIELAYGYMTGPSGSDYSDTNGGRDGGTAHVVCYEGALADLE